MKPDILLTNDDGILSPGLWAAASRLEELGFVHVVAPREQSSGMGRSLPIYSDGIIEEQTVRVNERDWQVFSVGGSPAQAVIHGVLEVLKRKPALVVSGINYGENFGTGVTISGTVGAAMEAAGQGIPALAVSLETDKHHHESYSDEVDFSAAAELTVRFARLLLGHELPEDVHLLKIEVPTMATAETPWEMTRLSMMRYYESLPPARSNWSEPARLDYRVSAHLKDFPIDSDVYVTRIAKKVAVTALSLDLTSRVSLTRMDEVIRAAMEND
ncbi:MAG TPA: 5'/3'-nucleotidase SurE [Anaerolineales bacterium]|nr:5'/3'-nucleotidase SurE [Anaerolineales bacterium]